MVGRSVPPDVPRVGSTVVVTHRFFPATCVASGKLLLSVPQESAEFCPVSCGRVSSFRIWAIAAAAVGVAYISFNATVWDRQLLSDEDE